MAKLFPLFLFYLLALSASAQVDLTLSPARAELALLPGEPFALTVQVRNGLAREEPLTVRLTPFRLREDGTLEELPFGDGLCAELRVSPTAFTLPPEGSYEVRLEGKAPPGEGTLACLVVFTAQPRPGGGGGVRVSLRPELGFALYVTLKGTEKPSLLGRVEGAGRALALLLENRGNVLERVTGEAILLDETGEVVARLPVVEVPVFPKGSRRVLLEPKTPLPPGRYRVVVLLEGKYRRYALEGVWSVP
ncbi:MAG: hypothetical protein ABWJ63_05865 [Thermus sp.]|uniref:hypothetical protein n=1 Tax=Thermus sp. TaxID=275 RepID=UPI00351ADCA5